MKQEQILHGIAGAPGLAIGKAFYYKHPHIPISTYTIRNTEQEINRLKKAILQTKQQFEQLKKITHQQIGYAEAAIFEAYLLILDDPSYTGEMIRQIGNRRQNAEQVCFEVTKQMSGMIASLDDEYMHARSDDIEEIGKRIIANLQGKPFRPIKPIPEDRILIAEALYPGDIPQLAQKINGIITAHGNAAAHSAILAKSLGIPVVLGLGDSIFEIDEDDPLILNGTEGKIILFPTEERQEKAREQIAVQKQQKQFMRNISVHDAVTEDGIRIHTLANISNTYDLQIAIENHAEGIGLLRSEFLFFEQDHWPTEEEQFTIYREILQQFGDKPVVIRTMDIGGDKKPPYAKIPKEENPFLGHRAIRYSLSNRDIFQTQLRALLKASIYGNLSILFPMVGSVAEIRAIKFILEDCKRKFQEQKISYKEKIPLGIMIEVPAAAIHADLLANEVDFLSIGTNDLTQYTLAADRQNEHVAHLYDNLHPAVLRLIHFTCQAAKKTGIPVSICGEMAGDPKMTELLIGLGTDHLSMCPVVIPEIKQTIARVNTNKARQLAMQSLSLSNGQDVRKLLEKSSVVCKK